MPNPSDNSRATSRRGGDFVPDTDNRRVLIVDDQPDIHDDFDEMLGNNVGRALTDELAAAFMVEEHSEPPLDFELLHAPSGEEALASVARGHAEGSPIAVAYIDIRMPPGIDGIETIRRIRRMDRDMEIVVMTAYTDKRLADIVQDMDALHKLLYIRKPFAREEIQQITLSLVAKWNLAREVDAGYRELADRNGRLEALLSTSSDAIGLVDEGGELFMANPGYKLLGDVTEVAAGQVLADELQEAMQQRLRELGVGERAPASEAAGGPAETGLRRGLVATGPERRLWIRSETPVRDPDGASTGVVTVLRDLTSEIEVQRLRLEVQRLETALARLTGTG